MSSTGQRKKSKALTGLEPAWPSKHCAGALSTELQRTNEERG